MLLGELQASPELQCYCVALLLNLKDWDYLGGITANNRYSGFVQVAYSV